MEYLILLHVMAAIIGVGPTFFGHVLVRRNQTPAQYRSSWAMTKLLEPFPKIGGSLAVLSGLALYFIGDYGSFAQLWLLGALVLYLLIQVTVVALITPASNQLKAWADSAEGMAATAFPAAQQGLLNRVNTLYWIASAMGVSLFILMVMGSRGYI
jgi:uncharacterized membrane protein SirB2